MDALGMIGHAIPLQNMVSLNALNMLAKMDAFRLI
jgi:hypothetical protein